MVQIHQSLLKNNRQNPRIYGVDLKNIAMVKLTQIKEKRDHTFNALKLEEAMVEKKEEKIRALKANVKKLNPPNLSNPNCLYKRFENSFDEIELVNSQCSRAVKMNLDSLASVFFSERMICIVSSGRTSSNDVYFGLS